MCAYVCSLSLLHFGVTDRQNNSTRGLRHQWELFARHKGKYTANYHWLIIQFI